VTAAERGNGEAGDGGTSAWAASVIGALEAQHALIEELAPLAERQGELIREGRSDALLDLLAQRQQIIDRFLTEADRLSGEVGDLTGRLESLAGPTRDRIRGLVSEIDARLAHVLTLDERDQQSLRDARDETRQQLAGLDTGRTARNAYVARAATNRYADHRG
jgi:hypothetical protein